MNERGAVLPYAFVLPLCSALAEISALSCNRNRSVTNCWVIVRILFVIQYKTRPAGKFMNRNVIPIGRINMIFACVGSIVLGVIFCWINIVAPMMIGNT